VEAGGGEGFNKVVLHNFTKFDGGVTREKDDCDQGIGFLLYIDY